MEALQSVQEAPLAFPSAEVVLDKVKSDGTFDQFRKTCLAAVEAEVDENLYSLILLSSNPYYHPLSRL